jgi:hypothetical protein
MTVDRRVVRGEPAESRHMRNESREKAIRERRIGTGRECRSVGNVREAGMADDRRHAANATAAAMGGGDDDDDEDDFGDFASAEPTTTAVMTTTTTTTTTTMGVGDAGRLEQVQASALGGDGAAMPTFGRADGASLWADFASASAPGVDGNATSDASESVWADFAAPVVVEQSEPVVASAPGVDGDTSDASESVWADFAAAAPSEPEVASANVDAAPRVESAWADFVAPSIIATAEVAPPNASSLAPSSSSITMASALVAQSVDSVASASDSVWDEFASAAPALDASATVSAPPVTSVNVATLAEPSIASVNVVQNEAAWAELTVASTSASATASVPVLGQSESAWDDFASAPSVSHPSGGVSDQHDAALSEFVSPSNTSATVTQVVDLSTVVPPVTVISNADTQHLAQSLDSVATESVWDELASTVPASSMTVTVVEQADLTTVEFTSPSHADSNAPAQLEQGAGITTESVWAGFAAPMASASAPALVTQQSSAKESESVWADSASPYSSVNVSAVASAGELSSMVPSSTGALQVAQSIDAVASESVWDEFASAAPASTSTQPSEPAKLTEFAVDIAPASNVEVVDANVVVPNSVSHVEHSESGWAEFASAAPTVEHGSAGPADQTSTDSAWADFAGATVVLHDTAPTQRSLDDGLAESAWAEFASPTAAIARLDQSSETPAAPAPPATTAAPPESPVHRSRHVSITEVVWHDFDSTGHESTHDDPFSSPNTPAKSSAPSSVRRVSATEQPVDDWGDFGQPEPAASWAAFPPQPLSTQAMPSVPTPAATAIAQPPAAPQALASAAADDDDWGDFGAPKQEATSWIAFPAPAAAPVTTSTVVEPVTPLYVTLRATKAF